MRPKPGSIRRRQGGCRTEKLSQITSAVAVRVPQASFLRLGFAAQNTSLASAARSCHRVLRLPIFCNSRSYNNLPIRSNE